MEEHVNMRYPQRGAPFFTLLRHPVERSLSATPMSNPEPVERVLQAAARSHWAVLDIDGG